MSARPHLPGVDALFGGGRAAPVKEELPPPANVKVSLYLPEGLLAQVDMLRAQLQLERGLRVDRSKVIRVAMRMALADPNELVQLVREEDA